jgi:hypothetical protein
MPRDDDATTWGEMVEAWRIMDIMTFLLPAAISFLHQFPLPSRLEEAIEPRWSGAHCKMCTNLVLFQISPAP